MKQEKRGFLFSDFSFLLFLSNYFSEKTLSYSSFVPHTHKNGYMDSRFLIF